MAISARSFGESSCAPTRGPLDNFKGFLVGVSINYKDSFWRFFKGSYKASFIGDFGLGSGVFGCGSGLGCGSAPRLSHRQTASGIPPNPPPQTPNPEP